MSNRRSGGGGRGGGGGEGSEGGAVADGIPDDVRKTIQNIREITSKQHSDDDIYTLLKECSMDADDAVQKLLYLDTFHKVKKKRDWKKETSPKQGCRTRGGRGNSSALHVSPDSFGGKRAASQRENGVNHVRERSSSSCLPAPQRTNKNAIMPVTKASGLSNGSSGLGNGSGRQLPVNSAMDGTKHHPAADMMKSGTGALLPWPTAATPPAIGSVIQSQERRSTSSSSDQSSPPPAALSGVYASASDPILAPLVVRNAVAVGTIKREVRSQWKAAEQNHTQGPRQFSDEDGLELPKNERECPGIMSHENRKDSSGKSKPAENQLYKSVNPSSLLSNDGPSLTRSDDSHSPEDSIVPEKVDLSEDAQAKANSQLLPNPGIPNGLVTFPNHFKVPEALRTVLTFGSFTAKKSGGVTNGDDNDVNSSHVIDSSLGSDETAGELALSDEHITSNGQVDHFDKPESPKQLLDDVRQSDGNYAPDADSKDDNLRKDGIFLQEGHQSASTQIAPTYDFGIVQPIHGGNLAQFDGHEAQAQDISRVSSFVGENPSASPSPSPTPPVQNSVGAAPLQPFLFRSPYPPNFFQYGPYFNPYFLPPMHHFPSHSGLAQEPSTGNAYGPTVKFPVPQLKPGTSPGNPTPIGLSPLYGSYGFSPIGFNPGPAVASGSSSAGKEDILASQLKENGFFTSGPVSEVSAWFPSPGQDISSLQLNPLYHITPQGHLTFSHAQAGHGAFTGVYAPLQTMTTSTADPLLQPSQTISTAVETAGLPSDACQQPKLP